MLSKTLNKLDLLITEKIEDNATFQRVMFFLSSRHDSGEISPAGTAWKLVKITTLLMALSVLSGVFIPGLKIGWAFGEGDLMTWFSFFALIAVGRISVRIWVQRRPADGEPGDTFAWRIFTIFFTFLAFDELLRIHETIDNLTHRLLGVKPTNITDHLDDAIVGLYGVFGLALLVYYRKEFFKFFSSLGYFAAAGACAFATVALDFLCSSKPFLKSLMGDPSKVQIVIDILDVFEEWFKIYSEIFFVSAFLAVFVAAKNMRICPVPVSEDKES